MYEVIRWISIGLMWLAVGMNLYAMVRCNRTYKQYRSLIKEVEAWVAYKKERGDWKCIEVEVSDERQD